MAERNMCNVVMRDIVVPPGSKSTSRANGSRRNLGYLVFCRRLFASAVRIGKGRSPAAQQASNVMLVNLLCFSL